MEIQEKKKMPNAMAVLVLGICSLVFSVALIGLVFAIVAIVLSKEGRKLNDESPGLYSDFKILNAGFLMAIIGAVISGFLTLLFLFISIVMGGFRVP